MKILQSSFFRALTAIAIGVLLIKYPDNTVTGIVITIGVLFALSGLISVLTYVIARRHESEYVIYDAQGRQIAGQAPMFPIVGIGSILLGTILAVMPGTFINALMYVIGAILILGAINQYLAIISVRRFGVSSLWFWLCPTLILLFGAFIIIKPMAPLSTAMFFLGWLTLFYGIVEALNSMLFYIGRRRWEKEQEELLKGLEATAAAEEMTDDGTQEAHEESEQRPSVD
jgi:uncharacterized membrane protein HdeD (DUF308 family)